MVWVKICANTTLEDAQAAIDLGADAVGFVFAPSSRRVTAEQVGEITGRLRGDAERIGVFQAGDAASIGRAVRVAGLTGVQLHEDLGAELVGALRAEFGAALTIAQTVHWVVGADGASTAGELAGEVRELRAAGLVDRVLVDSKVGKALGGTGRQFDWKAGKALFQEAGMRMIVAGGLNPENVGEAIASLKPWGVDVASGVEMLPGKKDPERLRLFIEQARAAAGASF